eukprot:g8335.t1
MLKKLWKNLPPEIKQQIISSSIDVAAAGAKKVSKGIQQLSGQAEEKLANLLGKPATKKVSKKARSMLKNLVKENKSKIKLPKKVKENLSQAEQKQLSKGSEKILSNLLYGRGLKIMA